MHRAKYRWTLSHLMVLILLAAAPLCARAAESKIGYVDVERISAESTFLKEMLGDIESDLESRRQKISEKEEAYQRLRDELRQKESVLTDTQLASMRKESRRLLTEIQNDTDDVQRMLRRAEREQMDPAFNLIIETIQEIGREEGFDLILRGDYVLYGRRQLDITDKVIERLDKRRSGSDKGDSATKKEGDDDASRRTSEPETGGSE